MIKIEDFRANFDTITKKVVFIKSTNKKRRKCPLEILLNHSN